MEDLKKKQEDIKKKLFSGNEEIVIKTIKDLRQQGSTYIIEPLFDLYATTQNKTIKKEIFSIIIDINDQKNAETLASLLNKPKYTSSIKDFLSMCWQANLDFSQHISLFVEIMINADLEVAFEAFTVFEESLPKVSPDKKADIISFLKSNISGNKNKELIYTAIKLIE